MIPKNCATCNAPLFKSIPKTGFAKDAHSDNDLDFEVNNGNGKN